MTCSGCQVVFINGVKCHEHGCPDAWRDYPRVWTWCGGEFWPETRHQEFCDRQCAKADHV